MGTVHRCFHTDEKKIYAMKRIRTQDLSADDIQGIEVCEVRGVLFISHFTFGKKDAKTLTKNLLGLFDDS